MSTDLSTDLSTDVIAETADEISGTTKVRCQVDDGIATVTLNRPDRLNAMDDELLQGTLTALERLGGREDVRVVVLTGAGRGFCAGGDLSAGPGGGIGGDVTPRERVGLMRRYMVTSQLLREIPKVTIAAVNGACAGAGMAWACTCDIRVASDKAVFRTAFVTAGLSGDFGGTWTLPRIVGPAKARELYLLNERLTATRALEIGLVSAVYPHDELSARVSRMAHGFAAGPPLALAAIKANLNEADSRSFPELLDAEIERHVTCMGTQDSVEAAEAFLAKRPPRFLGR